MTWFYNSYSGKLVHEDPPAPGYFVYQAALKTATGWHEVNVPPDASQADAQKAANAIPGGASAQNPNAPISSLLKNGQTQAGNKVVPGLGSAITSVEGFLSTLGDKNTWIRVVKISLGGAILIVGLLHLTGADKAIGGIAAKAVKVAPLL